MSHDDCIEKNIESIHALGKDHETYSEIFHVIDSGAGWSGELLFEDQGDKPCWVSARITLITNNSHINDHMVIMLEDISDTKKQQNALIRQTLPMKFLNTFQYIKKGIAEWLNNY